VSRFAAALHRTRPKSVWTGLVAVIGLTSAILGIIVGVEKLLPKQTTPNQSVAFILDVSPAMEAGMHGNAKLAAAEESKLAAAEQTILTYVRSYPNVTTSLRLVVPGGCPGTYADPTVKFASHNADRFQRVFSDPSSYSRTNYLTAFNSIANDLITKKPIRDSPVKATWIFVAGNNNSCSSQPIGAAFGQKLGALFFWFGAKRGLPRLRSELSNVGFVVLHVSNPQTTTALKNAGKHAAATTRGWSSGSHSTSSNGSHGAHTGTTGSTGSTGTTGTTGTTGSTGSTGTTGSTGSTGSSGTTGTSGSTGSSGTTRPAGPTAAAP
jgi:hypothetical protein